MNDAEFYKRQADSLESKMLFICDVLEDIASRTKDCSDPVYLCLSEPLDCISFGQVLGLEMARGFVYMRIHEIISNYHKACTDRMNGGAVDA